MRAKFWKSYQPRVLTLSSSKKTFSTHIKQDKAPFKNIKTEIIIDVSTEKAWSVLMDFQAYPEWNPLITKIEGKAQVGEQLRVSALLRGIVPVFFSPTIISLIPNKELIWVGSVISAQVFQGKHMFILEKINSQQTRFIHAEDYEGLIHKPVFTLIESTNLAGFLSMNEAFKSRCESVPLNYNFQP